MTKIHTLMLFFCLLLISYFFTARSIEAAPLPPLEHVNTRRDAQSTSGPKPPPGVARASTTPASPNAVVISNVPAYDWRHGCGPTAGGMVLGYWDGQGFDDLIPGDAASQTNAVNQAIASDGDSSNYTDYCLPLDSSGIHSSPLPDKSEPPDGDEHPDGCLADDMLTSQSARNNYYGWSWSSDVTVGLQKYVESLGAPYLVTIRNLYHWDNLTWDAYRAEIDAGRPLVLLVDTDGDGNTDHFVTAVGYDVDNGVRRYGAYDTWGDAVRWETFAAIAPGVSWGVWGATLFDIALDIAPPILDPIPEGTLVSATYTCTLTWSAVPSATHYQLEQSLSPYFVTPTLRYEGVALSHTLPIDVEAASGPTPTHYFRVRALRAISPTGQSLWSNIQSITIDLPTPPPLYLPLVLRQAGTK